MRPGVCGNRRPVTPVTLTQPDRHSFSMLRWAFTFLVIGIVAGLLGFTGVAGAAVGIAKILFFLFLALFTLFLVLGLLAVNRLRK